MSIISEIKENLRPQANALPAYCRVRTHSVLQGRVTEVERKMVTIPAFMDKPFPIDVVTVNFTAKFALANLEPGMVQVGHKITYREGENSTIALQRFEYLFCNTGKTVDGKIRLFI